MLEGVLAHVPQGGRVVVVDDGCTDATARVLRAFPDVTVVSHAANRGKGEALLSGFRYAQALGYTHVVTIDTDGQHKPANLPHFLEAIERAPESIWLGDRGLLEGNVTNAPGSSVFGCKFLELVGTARKGICATRHANGFQGVPYRRHPSRQLGHAPLRFRDRDPCARVVERCAAAVAAHRRRLPARARARVAF